MIRIVLADDHPLVIQGLRGLIGKQPDMRVVGEAGTADDVFTLLHKTPTDVLVLDVSMPGPGLVEVLRRLKTDHPRLRTLVLSMYSEEQYATRALKSGAAGYLTKDRSPELLIEAVRKVMRGGLYVTATLAERLAGQLSSGSKGALHEDLSDREFEVLKGLAAGKSVKELAAGLGISPKTVSTYRARILEKLGIRTNADLVRYVVEKGLGEI